MDWDAILQGAISAVLTSGIVVALIKSIVERRIDHYFDVQLKRYEAKLKIPTSVATKFAEERVDDYKALTSLIRHISRTCRDLTEIVSKSTENAQALMEQVDTLEDLLYKTTVTLRSDRLYDDVHFYKSEIRRVSRQLIDAQEIGDTTKKADRLKQIGHMAKEVLSEGDQIVARLEDVVSATTEFE